MADEPGRSYRTGTRRLRATRSQLRECPARWAGRHRRACRLRPFGPRALPNPETPLRLPAVRPRPPLQSRALHAPRLHEQPQRHCECGPGGGLTSTAAAQGPVGAWGPCLSLPPLVSVCLTIACCRLPAALPPRPAASSPGSLRPEADVSHHGRRLQRHVDDRYGRGGWGGVGGGGG